jgi:hypothetical protein
MLSTWILYEPFMAESLLNGYDGIAAKWLKRIPREMFREALSYPVRKNVLATARFDRYLQVFSGRFAMESLPFDERVARFWDRYRAVLARADINDAAARWYVIRVEEFLRSLNGVRLADQKPEHLAAYLRSVGRNAQLESWQRSKSSMH